MIANTPEKLHFDRIFELEFQIGEHRVDITELYKAAKAAGIDVKKLRLAVKRSLADQDKLKERRELEDEADDLRKALGDFHSSALGEAATRMLDPVGRTPAAVTQTA